MQLIILAGGQSRRMGQDKALLEVGACSLVAHQINALASLFDSILLVANESKMSFIKGLSISEENYSRELGQIVDELDGFEGPLSGLLAGLKESDQIGAEYVGLLACDMWGVKEEHFAYLEEALHRENADFVCFEIEGRIQPLLAVMKTSVLSSLDQYFYQGGRAVMPWVRSLQRLHVEQLKLDSLAALTNVNTPEKYQMISASLAGLNE